ncbi:MAG: hypothetical protein OHK0039_38180 [Bacteroidia bacterium]
MELFLDIVITLLWTAFALATLLGVRHEYEQHRLRMLEANSEVLDDDDPVYLLEP